MVIEDQELGLLRLIENSRAKRITVRYKSGIFQVSYPSFVSKKEVLSVVERMKPKLFDLQNKSHSDFLFTEETKFRTLTFDVVVQQKDLNNQYITFQNNTLYITFPLGVNIKEEKIQTLIKKLIENQCRSEANKVLPDRVRLLAQKYGFEVNEIKINNSRGRWGSCSMKKNINLSYFCMMLPEYLVDFVLLHELCHTKEMNHGENFWTLLNSVSNGQAIALTKELKAVKLKW